MPGSAVVAKTPFTVIVPPAVGARTVRLSPKEAPLRSTVMAPLPDVRPMVTELKPPESAAMSESVISSAVALLSAVPPITIAPASVAG